MSSYPRIIFMATPEFATASLGSLLMNGYNIVGIVTAPDKPAGRGKKIKSSAVSEFAEEKALDTCLFKTLNLKDPGFIESIRNLKPDIIVVVAFRMLPKELWSIPELGTFNLHASLLPQYRGAAPINHAIINGETTTGLTTFMIDEKIDTGRIIMRSEVHISHDDTAGTLHDRLMREGAKLVVSTVQKLLEGNITTLDQSEFVVSDTILKAAPKIFPENCIIDWEKPCEEVHNFVRGLSPYPGARTKVMYQGSELILKIRITEIPETTIKLKPGELLQNEKGCLLAGTATSALRILQLQMEGRKNMKAEEFLRGSSISDLKII